MAKKYYKIKNDRVYYFDDIMMYADYKTFIELGYYWAKDKRHIYHSGSMGFAKLLKNKTVDLPTFEALSERYLKDKNSVYYSDTGCYYNIIVGADPKTFQYVKEEYAKDKNSVYLAGYRTDYTDISTIKKIGDDSEYKKSNDKVYFYGELVKDADVKTFKVMPKTNMAIDCNNVYFDGKIAKELDAQTFKLVGKKFGSFNDISYAMDKNGTYIVDSVAHAIKNLNLIPKDFVTFKYGYTKDENHIYYCGKKIKDIDLNSFKIINEDYIVDKSYVYIRGKKIENSDAKTFILLDSLYYAKDKNQVYCFATGIKHHFFKVVKDADPATFVGMGKKAGGYGTDKENLFGFFGGGVSVSNEDKNGNDKRITNFIHKNRTLKGYWFSKL